MVLTRSEIMVLSETGNGKHFETVGGYISALGNLLFTVLYLQGCLPTVVTIFFSSSLDLPR